MKNENAGLSNRALGELGESMAVRYLEDQGFRIWARNFRCKAGEIDIIASKNHELSFIEVKTRRNLSYGRPCESVTAEKRRHIRMCAEYYLKRLEEMGYIPGHVKFDVIEIVIQHTECAF
ncbi:MAG: YraN family protein [Lentihominibacter sp.]